MAGEWREVQLGDVANLITGYPFKSQHYTDDASAPRLIGGDNIEQGNLRWDSVRRWPLDMTNGLDDYWLEPGDIVLAMDRPWIEAGLKRAPIGQQDVPSLLIQRTSRLRGTDELDTAFLRYVVGSQAFTQYVLSVQTGTAVPHISPTQIRDFRFQLPPLDEQRAIAHILGTLDDKIELNRRRNQTLEAMARTLFQDWFVDFGPVRAKMEGREPYLSTDLWQLFPDRLDDEGKPDGWDSGRLDDALILQRGFDLPASDRTHGVYPVMAASGINGYHDKFMVKGPGVTTGRSGVLGRVFLVQTDFWPLNTSLWVKEFKRVSPHYAFELLRRLDFEMFNAGSAVPTLNRNHVHNLPITLPPKRLIGAFDNQVVSMAMKLKANDEESKSLTQLRDTLLPKLISGELRIADAEKFAEAG